MTADEIIGLLGLAPHPEGGFFREMFRDPETANANANANFKDRAHSTAIYYLLREGEESSWHRVDASEVWHFYFGGPLEIFLAEENTVPHRHVLGTQLEHGMRPQLVVPAHVWQRARPLGRFALVGCTVAPGFSFSGFEVAPSGWTPAT